MGVEAIVPQETVVLEKKHLIGSIKKTVEKAGESEVYEAWASTTGEDRDAEIVLATAFQNLDEYLRSNPVIFYDHAWASWDAPSEASVPIGKALAARVDEEQGLFISWEFSKLGFAQKIKYLVDEGFLNMMSIGFIPKEWDIDSEGRRVYSDVELLEVSVVGIPSNREAQIMRSLGSDRIKSVYKQVKDAVGVTRKSGEEPSGSTKCGAWWTKLRFGDSVRQ